MAEIDCETGKANLWNTKLTSSPSLPAGELKNIAALMALVLIFSELLSLTGIATPPHETISHWFFYSNWPPFSFAIFGGYIIFLCACPSRRDNLITLLMGLFFGVVLIAICRTPGEIGNSIITGSAGFGIAAIIFLTFKIAYSKENNANLIASLYLGISVPVFLILMNFFHQVNAYFHPQTYDYLLYAFDDSLGLQISYWLGRHLEQSIYLTNICKIFYSLLPLVIIFFCTLEFQSSRRSYINLVRVFIATGLFGFLLYNVCPASGPCYRFGAEFPHHPTPVGALVLQPAPLALAPRNAMPSLHLAWALLIWWNSRQHAWLFRAFAALFLGLTVVSTLGLGEHYLIDLVVALPFAVSMQALSITSLPFTNQQRLQPFLIGMFLTLLWSGLLRYPLPFSAISPALPWGLIIITTGISLFLERRMELMLNQSKVLIAPE